MQFVTGGLGATDEQRATAMRSEVGAQVQISHDRSAIAQSKSRRRRGHMNLLAQRPMTDPHLARHPRHPVDRARGGTADVDDHIRVDSFPGGQRDANDPSASLPDLSHGAVEPQGRSVLLGRRHEVVGGQHRVVDEAGVGRVVATQLAAGLPAELRVVDAPRRPVVADVQQRQPVVDVIGGPLLVGHARSGEQRQHRVAVAVRRVEHQAPGGHESGYGVIVGQAEELAELVPDRRGLPGSQHTVPGRVVEADDGR